MRCPLVVCSLSTSAVAAFAVAFGSTDRRFLPLQHRAPKSPTFAVSDSRQSVGDRSEHLPVSGIGPTTMNQSQHHKSVQSPPQRRVVSVDRLDGDVLVTFDDGKTAVYPASVLYELLPQVSEGPREDTKEP